MVVAEDFDVAEVALEELVAEAELLGGVTEGSRSYVSRRKSTLRADSHEAHSSDCRASALARSSEVQLAVIHLRAASWKS